MVEEEYDLPDWHNDPDFSVRDAYNIAFADQQSRTFANRYGFFFLWSWYKDLRPSATTPEMEEVVDLLITDMRHHSDKGCRETATNCLSEFFWFRSQNEPFTERYQRLANNILSILKDESLSANEKIDVIRLCGNIEFYLSVPPIIEILHRNPTPSHQKFSDSMVAACIETLGKIAIESEDSDTDGDPHLLALNELISISVSPRSHYFSKMRAMEALVYACSPLPKPELFESPYFDENSERKEERILIALRENRNPWTVRGRGRHGVRWREEVRIAADEAWSKLRKQSIDFYNRQN